MKHETKVVRTACRSCHGVCQVLVHLEGDRVIKVTGDPDSPTSRGYLCPKGKAAPSLLYHRDRLKHPLLRAGKRGGNRWQRTTWEQALEEMASRFSEIKEESGAEFVAMINCIIAEDLYDHDFVDSYTLGFDRLAEHIKAFTPEWAGPITRLAPEEIRSAARTYARSSPACIQWGNGIDMSTCSFQTGRSLLILMAITGNIDRPGGNVLWVPPEKVKPKSLMISHDQAADRFLPGGQKERMIGSGRFPFCPNTHTPTFWESVLTGDPYRVRGLWMMGTNPMMTETQGLKIEKALRDHLEFTVVSDIFMTPTAQLADLVLPAATWLEQDDVVFFHKVWCVLARKKLAVFEEARDDRDVIFDLAHRLGLHEAFPWKDSAAYMEWVLEDTGLDFNRFCDLGILKGEMRYEKYRTEGFHTPSGKFELYSNILEGAGVSPLPVYREPPLSPVSTPELAEEFPLILISGTKIRNFFHSEYRQIEALRRGNPDPLVEIHPDTADSLGIEEGDWVWIESPVARVRMRARLFEGIAPDVVNAQHAWWFPEAEPPDYNWKASNVNLLYGDEHFDPDTGAEPIKCYLCRVYKAPS